MKNKAPENVLISPSPYVTLIYLLMNDVDVLRNTGYFLVRSDRASSEEKKRIRKLSPHAYFFHNGHITKRFTGCPKLYQVCRLLQLCAWRSLPSLWLLLTRLYRWPFLRTAKIWSYNSWPACRALIGNLKYIFIEEGIGSYVMPDMYRTLSWKAKIAHFLEAPFTPPPYAITSQAVKVIFTGIAEIPESVKDHDIEIISMSGLWEKAPAEKREFITRFFDLTPYDIEQIRKRDIIFVEQCFADDGSITFEENTEMLRKIFSRYDHSRIIIKRHYRSEIDYRKIFPDIFLIDKPIPMELIALCGERFTKAITISSTAVLQFPEDIEIEWLAQDLNSSYFSHLSKPSREFFENVQSMSVIPYRLRR